MSQEQVRLRPDRVAYAPVAVLLFGTLPLALSQPWLAPLLLVPLACVVWTARARVVAAPVGIEVCNGLGVRRFAWSQVDRFEVPRRGRVRLWPVEGRPVRLTALDRRALPRLLAVGQPAGAAEESA